MGIVYKFLFLIIFSFSLVLNTDSARGEDEKPECPPGSELKGNRPPEGDSLKCMIVEGRLMPIYHGQEMKFFSDGSTKELNTYHMGKLNGEHKRYWKNGQLKTSGQFLNGKKTGGWTQFYKDGKLRSQGEYLADKKEGEWTNKSSDGLTTTRYLMSEGKRLKKLEEERQEAAKDKKKAAGSEKSGPYVEGKEVTGGGGKLASESLKGKCSLMTNLVHGLDGVKDLVKVSFLAVKKNEHQLEFFSTTYFNLFLNEDKLEKAAYKMKNSWAGTNSHTLEVFKRKIRQRVSALKIIVDPILRGAIHWKNFIESKKIEDEKRRIAAIKGEGNGVPLAITFPLIFQTNWGKLFGMKSGFVVELNEGTAQVKKFKYKEYLGLYYPQSIEPLIKNRKEKIDESQIFLKFRNCEFAYSAEES